MTFIAIWVIVYSMAGMPVPFSALLFPGSACNIDAARAVANIRAHERGEMFQERIDFWCDAVKEQPPLGTEPEPVPLPPEPLEPKREG